MITLLSLGLVAAAYLAHWWSNGDFFLSPDGAYYRQMAQGLSVPWPYCGRPCLPTVLGASAWPWVLCTGLSLVAAALLMAMVVPAHPVLAVVAFIGCYGLFGLNVRLPVLVDAYAFALALLTWRLWAAGAIWPALLVTVALAFVHQRAGLFASLWAHAWPIALVSLIAVVFVVWVTRDQEALPDQAWLAHPIREARKAHDWRDWRQMLLPWGGFVLIAPFAPWTIWTVAALALGYAQLLLAQDRARLYQWALPALLPWLAIIPAPYLAAWCLVHLANPYRGT